MGSKLFKTSFLPIFALVIYTIFICYFFTFHQISKDSDSTYSYGSYESYDDCLSFELEDIKLDTSWPMSDSDALESLSGYSFNITNTCSMDIDYVIALETLYNSLENYIDSDYLKIGFDMNNPTTYRRFANVDSSLFTMDEDAIVAKKLFTSNVSANSTNTHVIKLWFDESTPVTELNKTFDGRIKILYGKGLLNDKESVKLPVSFATDSWETIAMAVKNNFISSYKVGDEKTIDMGKLGTHTLRIANINFTDECYLDNYSKTACGFVIEFKDIISYHNMNSTATNNGGYTESSMRKYLNDDIYRALPTSLKSIIIDTEVVSDNSSDNSSSLDKLYLLDLYEVYGSTICDEETILGYTELNTSSYTRQLDYYANLGVSCYNVSSAIKNNNINSQWNDWLLRNVDYDTNNKTNFLGISKDGSQVTFTASYVTGVSPAFRIG